MTILDSLSAQMMTNKNLKFLIKQFQCLKINLKKGKIISEFLENKFKIIICNKTNLNPVTYRKVQLRKLKYYNI